MRESSRSPGSSPRSRFRKRRERKLPLPVYSPEYARLETVELGPLSASMDAVILNSGSRSLLGRSFLSKFASLKIEGDRMVLRIE